MKTSIYALGLLMLATSFLHAEVAQQAYLRASNTDAFADNDFIQGRIDFALLTGAPLESIDHGERFGLSVAVSGETAVVGAPREFGGSAGVNGDQSDDSQYHAGAAYVFVRTGTSWTQQAYLEASNPDGTVAEPAFSLPYSVGDNFGSCVSISGNLLAGGAPGEDSAATGLRGDQSDNTETGSGAAYVFARTGTIWSQQAYVKASNTGSGDGFGGSLSLSGITLVVGVSREDGISTGIDGDDSNNGAEDAGACYVFTKPVLTWSQVHYLKPSYLKNTPPEPVETLFGWSTPSPDPNVFLSKDSFGKAVAIDGTIVLSGSEQEDSDAIGINGDQTNLDAKNSGAAYAFDLDVQPPVPQADIAVQYPVGRDLVSQFSAVDVGLLGAGQSLPRNFAIANAGDADLTGITIKVTGTHASDFVPSLSSVATLVAGEVLPLGVTFTPTGGGQREAILCVTSNDPDENPFTVELSAVAVSQNNDQDGDGMTDLAEYAPRLMGFDWRIKQTGLVDYYYQFAAAAGIYDEDQIGTLYAPAPILSRGASRGKFKLSMDWKRSADLSLFTDLPASPAEVSVNPQGDIEFEFDAPGNRAFFQILIGE